VMIKKMAESDTKIFFVFHYFGKAFRIVS
jgi:hypothetical protein